MGDMKSTKKVIDKALIASKQFIQASLVCADVGAVSGLKASEGKDEDVREEAEAKVWRDLLYATRGTR